MRFLTGRNKKQVEQGGQETSDLPRVDAGGDDRRARQEEEEGGVG